jgi:tetratricopeptide (TPR) repeat protein
MSENASLDALRREYEALRAELHLPPDAVRRAEVKRRLVELARHTDASLEALSAFREDLRVLAAEYRRWAGQDVGRLIRYDALGASTYVERGWHLLAAGDYAGAEAALRQALALAPNDLQALALLGWAEMHQHQEDRAAATFARVLAADPDQTLARVNVGYLCLRRRRFGEAIEHLSRVIRQNRDRKATLYAHYYLGLVYLARGMLEDAVHLLEGAVHLGPNLVEARCELGRALWFASRRAEAMDAWRAGASRDLASPWVSRCRELLALAESGAEVPRFSL